MNTVVYLVRHVDTIDENGELKDIDIIWRSSYTRAKQTAKYIANANNLPINLDYRLSERKLGNLDEIAVFMKDKKTRDPSSQEQLIYQKFRTSDGESAEDTNKRMTEFLNETLEKYNEKRIVIVSHGGSIKFLLLNWCEVNQDIKLEYKSRVLNITSPCLLKFTFSNKELVDLKQIV